MPDAMSRDPEVDVLRTVIHDLRWCKSSDMLHAVAHDEEDEDGYRAAFFTALHAAGYRVVAEMDHKPVYEGQSPRCTECARIERTHRGGTPA